MMGYSVKSPYNQYRLIFEGNSLFATGLNGNTAVQHYYIPTQTYTGLTKTGLAMDCYAVTARTQTEINTSLSTAILPYVKNGDFICLWEGTNDIYNGGVTQTGQTAFDNFITYSNTVRGLGLKLIACTIIARDRAGDPADVWTECQNYNTLMRANPQYYDALADFGSLPEFDTQADASNTDYYQADKLHLVTAGQALIITEATTAIQSIL